MTSRKIKDFKIGPNDLIVSPEGHDAYSGRLAEHEKIKNDGPLGSIRKAIYILRNLRHRGQLTDTPTIWLRGGVYPTHFPLEISSIDSNIKFCAWPGETPVIDGGVKLKGWGKCTVNNRSALSVDVKHLLLEHSDFNSLFVNGQRRKRARYPEKGYLFVDSVPDQTEEISSSDLELFVGNMRIQAAKGDLDAIKEWESAEMILLNRWIIERLPIEDYEQDTCNVNFKLKTRFFIRSEFGSDGPKTNRYYIENVKAGLLAPGNWYVDKKNARLYYLPLEGETAEDIEAVVPVTYQLLRLIGDFNSGKFVGNVQFKGLTFRHCDWKNSTNTAFWWDPYDESKSQQPRSSFRHFNEANGANPLQPAGAVPQGAHNLPGAIHMEAASNCSIENCTIEHIGFHGVDLRQGCTQIRVVGNVIRDLGAGGVNMDGVDAYEDQQKRNGWNMISDNRISSTGHVFPGACGILSVYSFKNVIMHNEIFDTTYSGISCGWMWGVGESASYGHRIEKNHIYNIGCRGDLSDMGGIYTLGFQPGTYIRNNLIHDVSMAAYGGWGIYTDEGSSGLIIENNIIHDTVTECIHEHLSMSIIWRNNIFAFSKLAGVNLNCAITNPIVSRGVWFDFPPKGRTFMNNIVVTDNVPIFRDGFKKHEKMGKNLRADLNLYWDYSKGKDAVIHRLVPPLVEAKDTLMDEYQRTLGVDRHSLVLDPLFKDVENRDFTLAEDSPALDINFVPIDISDVGPRNENDRSIDF